jgi:hypothetical protein
MESPMYVTFKAFAQLPERNWFANTLSENVVVPSRLVIVSAWMVTSVVVEVTVGVKVLVGVNVFVGVSVGVKVGISAYARYEYVPFFHVAEVVFHCAL